MTLSSSEQINSHVRIKMNPASRVLILAFIIILQLAVFVKIGLDKKEYHVDEIYTYMLSNSYDVDRVAYDDSKWDQWFSGDEFSEYVSVQDGEQFAYDKVFYNNSLDAHPPLYYCVIHTVSSLFPGQFSKWIGLFVNLLFMVGVDILIYGISRKMINSELLQFLPVFVYGLSPVAMEIASFIRMYAQLSFFAMVFCYCTVLMLKDGVKIRRLIISWLIIYLGAMTHYYALVLCFWGVLLFVIYLVKKKDIKHMLIYGIGSLIAVVLVYVTYPSILTQAFGSSTNNIGAEVSGSLFDVRLHLRQIKNLTFELFDSFGYKGLGNKVCIAIACMMLVLLVLALKKNGKSALKQSKEAIWVFGVFVLTFITVAWVGGEFVYLRYVYYVIPLIYVIVGYYFDKYMAGRKLLLKSIIVGSCAAYALVFCFWGAFFKKTPYLFIDRAKTDEIISEYSDYKLIMICTGHDRISSIPVGNFMKILNFSDVYLTTKESIEQTDVFGGCLDSEEQFVVYIGTDEYWLEGDNLDPDLTITELSGGRDVTYSEIAEGTMGEFYLVKKNS